MFADAMTRLNNANYACLTNRLTELTGRKNELMEAYTTSFSMTEKIDIQSKLDSTEKKIAKISEKLSKLDKPEITPDRATEPVISAAGKKISDIENSNEDVSVSSLAESVIKTVNESLKQSKSNEHDHINSNKKDIPVFTEEINFTSCSEDRIQAFRESAAENMKCAAAVSKAISENYGTKREWTLDAEGALNDLRHDFSDERIAFVLANAVEDSKDGRINGSVKSWASEQMQNVPQIYKQNRLTIDGTNPGLVSIFASRFINSQAPEMDIQKNAKRKKSDWKTINPEYFASLKPEERSVNLVPKESAHKIMKDLEANGIPFSAVERNEGTAITVSLDNENNYDRIADNKREERAASYINPEFYRSLPKSERVTETMLQPEAEAKVAELQTKGIPCSAVLDGTKSAVTTAKPGYFSRKQLKQEAQKVSNDEKTQVKDKSKNTNHGLEWSYEA